MGQIACFRSPVEMDTLVQISKPVQTKGMFGFFKKTLNLYAGKLENDLHDLVERGILHHTTRLISNQPISTFDLHPIVRRFAYDQLTASDRTAVHTRLVNYFDAIPKPEKFDKLEDLTPVIELYHHMVRAGNLDEALKLFYDRLHDMLYYQFSTYQLIAELLRALFLDGEDKPPHLTNESAQAYTLTVLANAYSMSGQSHSAIPLFEKKNEMREKMGDKKNLASGLGNVADDQFKIGALSTAERNLRRSIDLCREIEDEFDEAVGHQELGRILSYRGAWQEAKQELDTGLKQFETQHAVQSEGIIWSYRALRFLLLARASPQSKIENLKSSIECAKRSLEFAEGGDPNIGGAVVPRDLVFSCWLFGSAYRMNN